MHNLHWTKLRTLCQERGIDTSNVKGKESYIKLLEESMNTPAIITEATPADFAALNINTESIRIDKLKADLDSMRIPMKVPRRGLIEKRFGQDGVYYTIDTNELTIRFIGNPLGPICTTLQQPDKVIHKIAQHYLGTFTWDAGKNKRMAGQGIDNDDY